MANQGFSDAPTCHSPNHLKFMYWLKLSLLWISFAPNPVNWQFPVNIDCKRLLRIVSKSPNQQCKSTCAISDPCDFRSAFLQSLISRICFSRYIVWCIEFPHEKETRHLMHRSSSLFVACATRAILGQLLNCDRQMQPRISRLCWHRWHICRCPAHDIVDYEGNVSWSGVGVCFRSGKISVVHCTMERRQWPTLQAVAGLRMKYLCITLLATCIWRYWMHVRVLSCWLR